jgi:hypothetical protein
MENRVRNKEEWRSLVGKGALETLGEPPDPLVVLNRGNYSLSGIIIFYCPWCGAKLPFFDPGEQFPAANMVEITVDPAGHTTINGEMIAQGETVPDAIDGVNRRREPDNS